MIIFETKMQCLKTKHYIVQDNRVNYDIKKIKI